MNKAGNDNHRPSGGDTQLRTRHCPICDKPAKRDYRPFCTKRCADIDLGRWLSGVYLVPGERDEIDDKDQMSSFRLLDSMPQKN